METRIQKKRQVFVAVAASFLLLGIAFAPTATLAIDNNNSNEDYHSFAYSHNVTKTRAREKKGCLKELELLHSGHQWSDTYSGGRGKQKQRDIFCRKPSLHLDPWPIWLSDQQRL